MTKFDSGSFDWLVPPLLLPTPTTQFSLDHKRQSRKPNRKKWKRSVSSNSDSVELMTPLRTLISDFHQVISSLMTPTLTPSLVKPSLYRMLRFESFLFTCLTYRNVQHFRNGPVHEFYGLKASQMSKVRASSHEYPHVEKSRIFGNRISKVRWPTTVTQKN